MKNIAIFASGSGTNAENIIQYFENHPKIRVSLVMTNKQDAGVIQRAERINTTCLVFSKNDLYETGKVTDILNKYEIHFIVLAGFLWLIPTSLIQLYPGKIINIHPALLPSYGGKGMYGHLVHEAVIKNREIESGITIHLVNAEYDKGEILFQSKCEVLPGDTASSLAQRIHQLEYQHYPRVIEQFIERDR